MELAAQFKRSDQKLEFFPYASTQALKSVTTVKSCGTIMTVDKEFDSLVFKLH